MPVPDPTYITKNYRERGGARDVVQGELDVLNGGLLKINGANANLAGNTYTIASADVSGSAAAIATGLTTIASAVVQIVDGTTHKVKTSDAVVTFTGGTLTIAPGSTYALIAGDLIRWTAVGI